MNGVINWRTLTIFSIAFAARLFAISELADLPLSRTPQLDSLEYLRWAQQIAAHGFSWTRFPEHAPGYPYFIGWILMATGGSLTAVRIVQAMLASMSCVLTARIAARALTPRAFLPAGLLQALYAPLLYLDTALLAEPLLIFFSLLAVDRALATDHRRDGSLGGGFALGAAAIVRPTALVLIPAVWLAARHHRTMIAPLLLATATFVGPVMLQNWSTSGVPFIQAHGGMNFYIGNTVTSDGAARARPGGRWDDIEAEASRAGVGRNDQDAYFVRRTLAEAAAAPIAYLSVLANKAAWLTQQEELRDTHSVYFFREHLPLLAWLPGFGVVLGFAAVGVAAVREATAPRWLLWPILFYALTVIFFVVGLRYRAPLVPFVIAFAGAGIAHILDAAQRSNLQRLGTLSAIGLVVFALGSVRTDAQSRNVAEEWALSGVSLLQEQNLAGAEQAYRQAVTLDPQSSLAWDGLGLTLQALGRRAESRAAFERAIVANDRYALAWYHVAVAREQGGDLNGAMLAVRRANEITPERPEIVLALGLMLHRMGRLDEADPFLQKAAAQGEGRAHFALALTAMRNRDMAAARRHAEEAARLLPDYQPARELLKAVSQ